LESAPGNGKPNSNSAVVWSAHQGRLAELPKELSYKPRFFGSTVSTCAIHDGLVYAAELDGYVHCYDAKTGKLYWVYDLKAEVFSSPLCVDGKLYVGTMGSDLFIFACGNEKKLLKQIDVNEGIRASPIFANGTLYITTDNTLFAIREKK
jgi:outer membrane protein assembly factor BamB